MNIILTSANSEKPIDEHHHFITVGPNCWGTGQKASEALKNCKAYASRGDKLFITRVAPKGSEVDPVDGSINLPGGHDYKNCIFCTAGKGIRVNTDKSYKE